MSNYFIPVNSSHNIQTRSSQASLIVPRYRSLLGKSSFKYTGAVEWNSLPLGAQTIVEKVNFKKTIKCLLLDRVLEEENSVFIYFLFTIFVIYSTVIFCLVSLLLGKCILSSFAKY